MEREDEIDKKYERKRHSKETKIGKERYRRRNAYRER